MTRNSKRITDLSAGEKRSLLAKLLWKKNSDAVWSVDQLGIPVTDLQAEAVLDPAIGATMAPGQIATEPERIFMTGATGFLGAFLVHELLQQTKADIYCLVRSDNAEKSRKRLQETLASYGFREDALSARLIPVMGDLAEPLFGLSAHEFHTLASRIDTIYHNGAFVNWLYPYQRLKPSNVLGTQEVLRLASQERVKPVHFISSLIVFPILADSEVKIIRENDSLDHGGVLYGGYTQSKWVAEKLVTIAQSRGIPASIYRPAGIIGQSQTGVWNTTDVLCKVLKSVIELGHAPDGEGMLNMIPVDYVSKAVVHLSKRRESLGKAFHLANSQSVSWRQLVTWMRSFGYPLQPIPYHTWRAQILRLGRSQESTAYYLMPLFSMRLSEAAPSMASSMPKFDAQNTLAALAGTSLVCPPIDRHMFETYFAYFIRCGFLDVPPEGGMFRGLSNATAGASSTHTT